VPRKKWHSLSEYQTLRAMMEGNTTASAARRLGLSQSAVSRSLSSLEARIGTTLFEREAGRLSPTAAALQLNERLDALFQALDQIDGPAEMEQEILRLIAPPSFANPFLIDHIASFTKSNPKTFTSLEIGTSKDVVEGMQEERFDMGVIGVELSRAGIRLIPFRKSAAVCVMPETHPLAKRDIIRPPDLHGQQLIVLSYRHARRAQLDKILTQAGATPKLVAEVSNSNAAIRMVQNGCGLTVVNPFPSSHLDPQGLTFRRFASPISYQIYFAAPDSRPLPRVARQFMRHVRLLTPQDPFSVPV